MKGSEIIVGCQYVVVRRVSGLVYKVRGSNGRDVQRSWPATKFLDVVTVCESLGKGMWYVIQTHPMTYVVTHRNVHSRDFVGSYPCYNKIGE